MIYPGKPWHHKVIRSIQVDIQSQIEPLPSAKLPLLIAEFDMNRSAGIEIVSGAQGKDEFLKFIKLFDLSCFTKLNPISLKIVIV